MLDENDSPPMVVSPVSTVLSVRAGVRVGSTVAVIRALDTDTGLGGEVVVEIEDGELVMPSFISMYLSISI